MLLLVQGSIVGIYRRGGTTWWYRFVFRGKRIRASTRQTNARVAAQMESAHKTLLAKGEMGLREPQQAPTLSNFATQDFLPFVRSQCAEKLKTLEYYENGTKNLIASKMAGERLDDLTTEKFAKYVAHRREKGLQTSSINRELQVLRRMLRLAEEWKRVDKTLAKIRMLPGERRRDRVLTLLEEQKYLSEAPLLLRNVVTILIDCGLRPEECMRLRWDEIRDGSIHVPYGKTKSARRIVPLSERALACIEERRGNGSEWVFPAKTRSGHIETSSLRKAHHSSCKRSLVQRFQMYALRHTCLTRWAAHMDPYTLAYLAGHSDMATTRRYVHPEQGTIRRAILRARSVSVEETASA
jgi:integrase